MDRRGVRRLSTIRARTVAAACTVVAVALVLGAVLVLVVLRNALVRHIDNAARDRAEEVADLVRNDELPRVLAVRVADETVVQVVGSDGAVVTASANVRGDGRISVLSPDSDRIEVETVAHLPLEEEPDDRFRIVALGASSPRGPVTVYVAASLEPVNESVATVSKILLVGLPGVLLVVGITSWFVVGRALRPVDAIREEVDDISAGDLHRRVPEPATDDEIGRLARGMNQMLDRLQSFSDRQRRFVADASHELQSPLASSQALLDVALAHPDEADWVETANAVVDDNHRMTRLVQNLLFLARADSAMAVRPRALLDLDDVVLGEIARVRHRSTLEIDSSRVTPVEVRADHDQIVRVVRNLLENAVRYASTKVTVELAQRDDVAELVVGDDGPGVAPENRDRIFERFTRVDDSRSRHTGGFGLGLAIAREIVESHRGTILVVPSGDEATAVHHATNGRLSPNGDTTAVGARFVVRLPIDAGVPPGTAPVN